MTLEQLFAVPREARDDSWVASFFATIPQAPLATIPEPVMQGPDGFPYFVLKLPPGEPRTLAGVVFDYGSLFSYRAYGMFDGDAMPP